MAKEHQCDLTEDHEKYAGKVIPDPWDDPKQKDWKMAEEASTNGVGTDKGHDAVS